VTSRHGCLPYFRRKEVLSFEDVLAVGLMTAEIPAGDHAAEVPVVALRLPDGSWRPLGPPAGWRGFLGRMWSREAARKAAKELAAVLGVPFEWK
jgi:hypothetical protein